jgi:hypothetical protein
MNRPVMKLLTAAALALPFWAGSAQAQQSHIDEVRFLAQDHDTGLVGSSKEDGADLGVEIFSHPVEQLSFLGSPRFVLGGLLNTAGQTDQLYVGIDGQKTLLRDVFQHGDSFFIEGVVGATLHNGKIDVRNTPENDHWKSHGSHLLYRTGFGAGYHFDAHWSLAVTFAHISNANEAHPNQGSNNIGLALGWKF